MQDNDNDGFGDNFTTQGGPPSEIHAGNDCDDESILVHPQQDEYCNEIDDNCDGSIDDSDAIDQSTWYHDADNDGFGNIANTILNATRQMDLFQILKTVMMRMNLSLLKEQKSVMA